MAQRSFRACPLCEATCGIVVETEGRQVLSVRGDDKDPFSRGYICPKAHALKELQHDPDRLRRPIRRKGADWQEIPWDEVLGEAAENLLRVRTQHGPESLGIYLGNPSAHNLGAMLYGRVLVRAPRGRAPVDPAGDRCAVPVRDRPYALRGRTPSPRPARADGGGHRGGAIARPVVLAGGGERPDRDRRRDAPPRGARDLGGAV